jgi:hypothetical protein
VVVAKRAKARTTNPSGLSRQSGALGPITVRMLLGKFLPTWPELCRIMGLLVLGHSQPIKSFGAGVCLGVPAGHFLETFSGVVEFFAVQPKLTHPQRQIGKEILRREKALHPVMNSPLIVGDNDAWRPSDEVLINQLRIFFDMHSHRDEVVSKELSHTWFGIRHGIHGDATLSLRGGTEVQKNRLLLA